MSTHNLGMMHDYCDDLMIINKGVSLVQDTPRGISKKYPGLSIEETFLKIVDKRGGELKNNGEIL